MAGSHEIFISHSSKEAPIAQSICKALEKAGNTCWIAPRDIEPGEPFDEAIMRGLLSCRMVLLVFSEATNESEHVKRELLQAQNKRKIILPVRVEDVKPSERLEYVLTGIQWFDMFSGSFEQHLDQLTAQVCRKLGTAPSGEHKVATPKPQPTPNATGKRVTLIHKRNAVPDTHVVEMLETSLQSAGFQVFVDRESQIGLAWAQRIADNMTTTDFVIPIVSVASAASEMVVYEVDTACSISRDKGCPEIFPVWIGPQPPERTGADTVLPTDPQSVFLQNGLQNAPLTVWQGESDDASLKDSILKHLKPENQTKIVSINPRDMRAGGAVPLTAQYYIPRPSDEDLHDAIRRRDTIVLIKGGRQMGKTSLLARGLQEARKSDAKVVYIDLQKLNSSDLTDIRSFYVAMAGMIADALNIEKDIQETWRDVSAPSVNFERYLKRQVMPAIQGHFFWALDEVDRLFTTPYGSEFFGLIRSWHNERAADPETPWGRLTILISYATEAHLFIADPNQSPFNVGTKLELRDFTLEQEQTLNQIFESPIVSEAQMQRFNQLLNGQPYLVTRGLQELAVNKPDFDNFVADAERDEGPFGDHLRRILVMLCRDPRMIDGVKAVLDKSTELTMEAFYRLRAAGLVIGDGASDAHMRCELYATYLGHHLDKNA